MKRFILSAFSVLLATAAVAPIAQASTKVDANFNIQTLRLSEFDVRNKSEEASQQPYDYPEASTQPSAQTVSVEDSSAPTAESTEWERSATWETPTMQEAEASSALSLIEQRHQSLDRS
ncbi:MAG: hypothetical protein ACFB16_00050 [Phormidesmis sp.]